MLARLATSLVRMILKGFEMPRQSGPKSNFRRKLLILNRITALSRFAEPFQNLSNHFKIEIEHIRSEEQAMRIDGSQSAREAFHRDRKVMIVIGDPDKTGFVGLAA